MVRNGLGRRWRGHPEAELMQEAFGRIRGVALGDLTTLAARFSEPLDRPIEVATTSEVLGPDVVPMFDAAWFPARARHYIFIDDSMPLTWQANAVCHEFGHIILGHPPAPLPDDVWEALFTAWFPDLNPNLRHRIRPVGLCRRPGERECVDGDGAHGMEVAAESFGRGLAARMSEDQREIPVPVSDAERRVVQRLAAAFGQPQGVL